jgi:hypothetical protein
MFETVLHRAIPWKPPSWKRTPMTTDCVFRLQDALPIAFERFNAMLTLWNFQLAVILGLLAFVASNPSLLQSTWPKAILSSVYLLFALANVISLLQVGGERRVLDACVLSNTFKGTLQKLPNFMKAPNDTKIIGLHLIGDVVALALIFGMPDLIRKIKAR